MSFAVFLDVDGVLNSRTTCERTTDYHLESHPEIDEYVVLDDNEFDFRDYPNIWERLLLTNGIERAKFASKTPAIEAMLFMDYIKDVS